MEGGEIEERGRIESGGKNEGLYYYERERRKWIGGRGVKRKGFAGPMSIKLLPTPLSSDTGAPYSVGQLPDRPKSHTSFNHLNCLNNFKICY